jgi:hypothetical protein
MGVTRLVPPPPSPTWTGFYAGVNAGLRTNQNEMQVDTLPYKIGLWDDRGVGGVQAGYNWEFWPRSAGDCPDWLSVSCSMVGRLDFIFRMGDDVPARRLVRVADSCIDGIRVSPFYISAVATIFPDE